MSEPEWKPDVDADAALALIQAENDYRSALVGPVSPDALSLLQAEPTDEPETGAAGQHAGGEPDR